MLDFHFYVYGSSYKLPPEVVVGNNTGMRTFLPPDGWLILGAPHSHLSTEQFNKLFSASTLARYRELGIGIASNWNCAVQDTATEKHPAAYDTQYIDKFQRAFYPQHILIDPRKEPLLVSNWLNCSGLWAGLYAP